VCGIVGIKLFNDLIKKNHIVAVEKALEDQQHRGPDAQGLFSDEKTVLGHNRLSIIDKKERSNQPMTDTSSRYQLVFNGEIYNYSDLKNDLLRKGIHFQTSSDTEVLLYHLIESGAEGINELDGCFSFAFYDSLEDELILARDHYGINPLLFSLTDEGVFFSSEMWFYDYLPGYDKINHQALNEYFQFTYIAAPNTILSGVQKLLPGHYLHVKGKYCDLKSYTKKSESKKRLIDSTNLIAEGKRIIEDAVIKRLAADVPLGTFLSGGIDSSIVSAIAAEHKSNLNTFSIGFKDSPYHDESKYAQIVARQIGSAHHPIMLEKNEVIYDLPKVLSSMDEPFADSSAVAMFFLAKKTKEHVTVSLSGDGADELLGGYNKHKAFIKSKKNSFFLGAVARFSNILPEGDRNSFMGNRLRQLQRFHHLKKLSWPDDYFYLASFLGKKEREDLLLNSQMKMIRDVDVNDNSLDAFLRLDQAFVLQGDMLKKVDLMSMRNSLEVRTPFLDKEVISFCNELPTHLKHNGKEGKIFLRKAFKDQLPNEIFARKKQGFEVPLLLWVKSAWNELVEESWFEKDYIVEQNIFNAKFVQQEKQKFFSKNPGDSPIFIWSYIVFQFWYQRWKRKKLKF
jgi:asparagine synthase (glutamine-hydrolysing)